MEKGKYQWQGEPVKVYFGNCVISTNKEKPLYWYNYECIQISINGSYNFPAILVECHDQKFVLSNHYGIGVHKLLRGGWPNMTHFSLDEGKFRFNEDDYKIEEFDEKGYLEYEKARSEWQKWAYPEEYEKTQQLLKMAAKLRAGN